MAYNGYGSSDPYQHAGYNMSGQDLSPAQYHDRPSYYQPPPQQSQQPQPPYPDHYGPLPTQNQNMSHLPTQQSSPAPPGQQQPSAPPPQTNTAMPEPYPDPSHYYPPPSTFGVNDAIASEFQKSGSGAYISPDLVSQITANVIEQLRGTNLDGQQNRGGQEQQQQPSSQPPHPSNNDTFSPTFSTHSDTSTMPSAGATYTPPSPYRAPEESGYQPSPSMSQARFAQNIRGSPRRSPVPRAPQSPVNASSSSSRPRGPERLNTATAETTLEKIWGQLFDTEGNPTPRLGQLLRGIAVHLIEKFPPGPSIVVTPEKLQKYYEDTKVSTDTYPWWDIFDDRTSLISRLYREIEAEHHLIQARLDERPDIPGLTPRGFERWMTLMIQAHPDQEYDRLQQTVLEMPINNPDEKKERFPKEISRRLFPKYADPEVKEFVERALITHCRVDLTKPSVPGPSQTSSSNRRRAESFVEPTREAPRGHAPPPNNPCEGQKHTDAYVEDDHEENAPSRPIERERKPYSAQPGGGKVYDDPSVSKSAAESPTRPSHTYEYKTRSGRTRSPSRAGGKHSLDPELHTQKGAGGSTIVYGPNTPPTYLDDFEDIRYRDVMRDRERDEGRYYDPPPLPRERAHDKERGRHHDGSSRGSWGSEEEYYRSTGLLGGNGGGPPPGGKYR